MPARTSAPLGAVLCLAVASITHAAVVRPVVDGTGLRRAAGDLAEDVFRVTGVRPALSTMGPAPSTKDDVASDIVIVGIAGRSAILDRLAKSGRIDLARLRGQWEASTISVVLKPWRGVERAVVVAGSDKRGAIYGVYDLSEAMGVSP